jgi:hypothetical protein
LEREKIENSLNTFTNMNTFEKLDLSFVTSDNFGENKIRLWSQMLKRLFRGVSESNLLNAIKYA